MQAVKVYNLRNVDELVFLDVTATAEGRGPDLELIDELADECFMPLAVGGGIRSVDDVRALLGVGADKVVIGTAALRTPEVVREAADRFGSQCVVVSIDTRDDEVCTKSGTRPDRPRSRRRRAASRGARRGRDPAPVDRRRRRDEGLRRRHRRARERRGLDPGDRLGRRRHLRAHGRRARATVARPRSPPRACSTSPSRPRWKPSTTSPTGAFPSASEVASCVGCASD